MNKRGPPTHLNGGSELTQQVAGSRSSGETAASRQATNEKTKC